MDRISTHAPAGGATVHLFQILVAKGISTHAPAGGATVVRHAVRPVRRYFYSRPCGRGDRQTFPYHQYLGFISTHAPAGGATAGALLLRGAQRISTHAPAGGATKEPLDVSTATYAFLLTPLREGRPRYGRNTSQGSEFLLTPLREGRPLGTL